VLSDELEPRARRGLPLGFWIFVLLLSTLVWVKLWVVGLVEVRGQSMEPTIASGSTCLVLKAGPVTIAGIELMQRPLRRDDLVVAKIKHSRKTTDAQVIKRVAAVSGQALQPSPWLDRLRLTKTVRGKPVLVPGLTCSTDGCRVNAEHVFLLSEQLKGSYDSRQFGAVPIKDVTGRITGCF